MEKAISLGAELILGAEVVRLDTEGPSVTLKDGRVFGADIVIGADGGSHNRRFYQQFQLNHTGLWSAMRECILGKKSDPHDTGDLAYRGILTLERILEMRDPRLLSMIEENGLTVWAGPDVHAVLYPVRDAKEYNLVLL